MQRAIKNIVLSLWTLLCFPVFSQSIQGIDVSYHQGDINWQLVSADGKQFAYVKATEGKTYTDPNFQTNMELGSSTDIIMGAYHFARPDNNSATEDANNFISVAAAYIGNGHLPPALDLEDTQGNTPLSVIFSQSELSSWVLEWLNTVEYQTGVKPIIYTSSSYANYLDDALNTYPLWIPKPGTSPNTPPSNLGIWNNWKIKQYSWEGNVEGISGFTDLNIFNGTISEFNDFINGGSIATLDCSNSITLNCGENYSGSSSSASSNVSAYGCNSWTETGPERIHSIIAPYDGKITATISNFAGDLDVYILGSCNPNDCLGTVYSSEAVFENAQANHEYFIVVDADDGSGSSYDLIVSCFQNGIPDLVIDSMWTDPNGIEIDDNVNLFVKIKNIGDQTNDSIEVNCKINDATVNNILCKPLNTNETEIVTIPNYNFSSTGEHNYCAYISPIANETNIVNNNYCITVNVLPENSFEDITVTNANVLPKTVNAGENILATAVHSYFGNQNTTNTPPIELGFYLSGDSILNSSDILMGTKTSNLGSNTPSQNEELNFTIPNDTPEGDMFIIFNADNNNVINEGANESNNSTLVKITVKNTSEIKEQDISMKIQLYPNPVSDILNIKKDKQIKINKIIVYNRLGQVIRHYNNYKKEINFTDLSNGVYFITFISSKDKKASFQVIKN